MEIACFSKTLAPSNQFTWWFNPKNIMRIVWNYSICKNQVRLEKNFTVIRTSEAFLITELKINVSICVWTLVNLTGHTANNSSLLSQFNSRYYVLEMIYAMHLHLVVGELLFFESVWYKNGYSSVISLPSWKLCSQYWHNRRHSWPAIYTNPTSWIKLFLWMVNTKCRRTNIWRCIRQNSRI
jgi:hypothetical protein